MFPPERIDILFLTPEWEHLRSASETQAVETVRTQNAKRPKITPSARSTDVHGRATAFRSERMRPRQARRAEFMSGSQFRAALTEQKLRAFIVERGLEPITNESQIAALSRSQLDEERAEGAALDRGLSSPAPDEDAGRRIDSLSNAIDVKTKFAPTRELLTAWLEAANENLVAAGQPTISLSEALDDRSYYVELGKKIASFFRNYAVRKSYEVERYRITFAGRFLLSIENLVVDRFMLPPRIAVRFLDLLVEQVLAQSKQGEVFFGSWGKLVVDEDGELLLRLERRRPLSLAKLLKAG